MSYRERIFLRARSDELLIGLSFLAAGILNLINYLPCRVLGVLFLCMGIVGMIRSRIPDTSESHRQVLRELMEARSHAMLLVHKIFLGVSAVAIVLSFISAGPSVPYFKITMICFFAYLGAEHLLTFFMMEKTRDTSWKSGEERGLSWLF